MADQIIKEVQECLVNSCAGLGFRDILTSQGISPEELIIVEISNKPGNILARYNLPAGSNSNVVQHQPKSLQKEVRDFLTKADPEFKMLSTLFNGDPTQKEDVKDPSQLPDELQNLNPPPEFVKYYNFWLRCGRAKEIDMDINKNQTALLAFRFYIFCPCGSRPYC